MEKLNVIILAAGKGTRMKSALPKVLHKLCGKTLIDRAVSVARELNPEKIVLVLGEGRELVEKEVSNVTITYQEEQKGTGDAARVGLEACDGNVLILPGDAPLIKSEILKKLDQTATVSLLSFNAKNPTGFGRIDGLKIVEEKDADLKQKKITEVNSSIYLTNTDFLKEAISSLSTKNSQGEYYLTDIVEYAASKGEKVSIVNIGDSEELLGANTREELSRLEEIRRAEINSFHMKNGVSFEDPSAAYIDEGVEIGADSYIGSNTRLKGATKIGERVYFEGDSLVIDSTIAAGSKIKLGSRIENSTIGEKVSVGPFSQLRPGTVLDSEVKVGNFVEVKNSHLKKGVKAGHLSYLGDSELGEEVNVGAGTITCNYDGKNKHKTKIEEGVFIGSNTSLVAPLEIGKNALIGAGSVITKNVPENHLAIERSQQKNLKKRKD